MLRFSPLGRDRLVLAFFPFERGFLCRGPAHLHDMASRPTLLMFLFAAIQVRGDAAVFDFVSDLVIVFIPVSRFGHGPSFACPLYSRNFSPLRPVRVCLVFGKVCKCGASS